MSKLVENVLRLLDALSKYLARGSDEIGITYEITSSNGVKSYLIGTFHMVDRESIQKSAFKRIIAECSRLYSEAGTDACLFAPYTGLLKQEEAFQHLPFHYFLDTAITAEAQRKKIPVHALDMGVLASLDQERNDALKLAIEIGTDAYQKHITKYLENQFKENTPLLSNIKAWKIRDIEAIAIVRDETCYDFIAPREDRWMDILLPVLIETKRPICIAVGAAHVVGYDSLTARFKNAGFKVELITRSGPGFLEQMIRKVETMIRGRYV